MHQTVNCSILSPQRRTVSVSWTAHRTDNGTSSIMHTAPGPQEGGKADSRGGRAFEQKMIKESSEEI